MKAILSTQGLAQPPIRLCRPLAPRLTVVVGPIAAADAFSGTD